MRNNRINFFNIFSTIYEYFYAFQLLDYDIFIFKNYIKKIIGKGIRVKTGKLIFTKRIIITLLTTVLIEGFVIYLLYILSPLIAITYLIAYRLFPIGIYLSFIINHFIFEILRYIPEIKAKNRVKNIKDIKIIGITGSYGKTTVKNYIYQVISPYFKVQMVEGNINTATGIANWINTKLQSNTKIIVVEMGAYRPGEIARSCQILPPDIAIITTIGEQHLERYLTLDNIAKAKSEIFTYAKSNAFKITGSKTLPLVQKQYTGTIQTLEELDDSTQYSKNIVIEVSKFLGIEDKYIQYEIHKVKNPDRRSTILNIEGYSVIDDSYNINIKSAKRDIELLTSQNQPNKIVILGGIPEAGPKTKEFNEYLSSMLNQYSQIKVLLLNTDFSPYFSRRNANSDITIFDTYQAAWNHIKHNYSKDDTVVLQLPELTDLYY